MDYDYFMAEIFWKHLAIPLFVGLYILACKIIQKRDAAQKEEIANLKQEVALCQQLLKLTGHKYVA